MQFRNLITDKNAVTGIGSGREQHYGEHLVDWYRVIVPAKYFTGITLPATDRCISRSTCCRNTRPVLSFIFYQ